MAIYIERIEHIEKAFARLRQAPLEATLGEQVLIYENASMRLMDFIPEELNLTSLYVLRNHLERLQKVNEELMDRYDIDILHQSAILHLRTEDGNLFCLAPPVVEIYEEAVQIVPLLNDQNPPEKLLLKIPILKDGVHRAWVARENKDTMKCIVIHGALKNYPPYAYPNAWSELQVYDTKPTQKKFYRRSNPYSYMRPLKALRQIGDMPSQPEWGR